MVFVPILSFAARNGDIAGQVPRIALQILQLQLFPLQLLRRLLLATLVATVPSGTAFVPIPFIVVLNGDIVGQVPRIAPLHQGQLLQLRLLRPLLLAALVATVPSGTAFVPIPFIVARNGDIVELTPYTVRPRSRPLLLRRHLAFLSPHLSLPARLRLPVVESSCVDIN